MSSSAERIPSEVFDSGWDPVNQPEPRQPDGGYITNIRSRDPNYSPTWHPDQVPEDNWQHFIGSVALEIKE